MCATLSGAALDGHTFADHGRVEGVEPVQGPAHLLEEQELGGGQFEVIINEYATPKAAPPFPQTGWGGLPPV